MKKLHARKGGFTLIELMIVVAIIGILAAIAIPNFLRFQLKAKSSEGKTNLAAIRTAEQSFYSEFGRYQSALPSLVTGNLGAAKQGFVSGTGFDTIGWSPEGQVFFSYAVGTDANDRGFYATAMADIDDDNTLQAWGYQKPVAAGTPAPIQGGHVCTTAPPDDQVGPCATTHGQSIF